MQELLIENIRTDGAVQSRSAINAEYVHELSEMLKAGQKLPPVDVYKADGETWLADGFHRLRAHEAAGIRNIRAEVHKGDKAAAAWHSAGANITHGLRRTNADKRHSVALALKVKPTASDRLIADHCGVDHNTVAMIRKQTQVAESATSTRVGKDGKTYKRLPPPPPPQRVKQEEDDMPKARLPPPPPPKPEEPEEVDPSQMEYVDDVGVGNPIPDHLVELFKRGNEIQKVLASISAARCEVKAAENDPLWAECDMQAALAGLSQAYDAIKATKPYSVCPWCHGKAPMQRGCKGCGGRGLIGKFRYDNIVPSELKN